MVTGFKGSIKPLSIQCCNRSKFNGVISCLRLCFHSNAMSFEGTQRRKEGRKDGRKKKTNGLVKPRFGKALVIGV